MDRINRILAHPVYRTSMAELEQIEQNRIYCRHGLDHQLDVARIAWILSLEAGDDLDKDVVYGTALLHDLGRSRTQEEHDRASGELARIILPDCGYSQLEADLICHAVAGHRRGQGKCRLTDVIHRADRLSRNCFGCQAEDTCKWSDEKKNKGITV